MIKINLIAEAKAPAAAGKKRPEISLGAKQGDIILLIFLVITAAAVGAYWYKLSSDRDDLDAKRARLREQRDSLQKYIDQVNELEATRAELKKKIGVIKDLKKSQTGPVRIMDEVSKALPDLVWLTGMQLKGTTMTLNGFALGENAVANYIDNLDGSSFFGEPELKIMSRADAEGRFRFTLNCRFVYAPQESSGEGGETG
jgi:type IV pilus assembly protein PilN